MVEILKVANQFSSLIDVALLVVMIGLQFRLSSQSRTALADKHGADLTLKETEVAKLVAEVSSLKLRLESKDENYTAKVDVLNHQLTFFQGLSRLPEDQRFNSIKLEYEEKIRALEEQLAREELPPEQAKQEIADLQNEAKVVSELQDLRNDKSVDVLPMLIRILSLPFSRGSTLIRAEGTASERLIILPDGCITSSERRDSYDISKGSLKIESDQVTISAVLNATSTNGDFFVSDAELTGDGVFMSGIAYITYYVRDSKNSQEWCGLMLLRVPGIGGISGYWLAEDHIKAGHFAMGAIELRRV